jgi:heat shock protein HslJ
MLVVLPSAFAYEPVVFPDVLEATVEGQEVSSQQMHRSVSELRDTFWHLEELHGITATFPSVLVNIELLRRDEGAGIITFTTPTYSVAFSFVNKPTGIEFSPTYQHKSATEDGKLSQDQRTGEMIEDELLKTSGYNMREGLLTFEDKDHRPNIVLSAVHPNGIENRRWRIAKYHGEEGVLPQKEDLNETKDQADIIFMNGRIYGSPGCGSFTGTYTLVGGRVTSDVGLTLAGFCYSQQFVQDNEVGKALKGERRIKKDGQDILLYDKSGKAMILLVPFNRADGAGPHK